MDAEQLPYLETFVCAAERSSFTAAAKELGLTQAAVSQRIGALEQVLDVPLFTRQGGHVLLTDAGRRLHDYARRILELHREAIREVAGRRAPLTGELVLAASSIPAEHLLAERLATFRQRHPHVRVRVAVSDSREVMHQVEHGTAHLGLVGTREDNPHLEFGAFATDRLALVVPAGHPWAGRKRVTLTQLAGEPLVLREPGSGSRACLERALARAGTTLTGLRVALEVGSNEAIKDAVQRGMGIAVLSTHAVAADVAAGRLHALAVAGLRLERPMYVVRDRRRALPIAAQLFLDLLRPPGGTAAS